MGNYTTAPMSFCPANETFLSGWSEHGLPRCFLETLGTAVPAALLAFCGFVQLLYYRRYAAPADEYRQPSGCLFYCQIWLHIALAAAAMVRLALEATDGWLPVDERRHYRPLYGYQVSAACCACAVWLPAVALLMLERRRRLPSVPVRGHGLPLLTSWGLMLAAEPLYLVNCRSPNWWFQFSSVSDGMEFGFFMVRLLGAVMLFFLGLRAPGMAWNEDYIPYMNSDSFNNPRLTSDSATPPAVTGSTWRGVVRKMSRLLPFVWPRGNCQLQLIVLACFSLLMLTRVTNVYVPVYSKLIIDEISVGKMPWRDIGIFVLIKFLMGGGTGGMGFLNNIRSLLWIQVQQFTEREVQVELFAHLHKLSLRWHLSRKTGEVLRVMDRGTNSINSLLNYLCFQILPTFIDILVAIAFFTAKFNGWFGLIVLVAMVLYLGATVGITEWRTKYRRLGNLLDNAQRTRGVDSLLNYETVKYYDAEEYEVQRYREAVLERQRVDWSSQASLNLLNTVQNVVINGGLLAGSLLCAHMIVVQHTLTLGDYVLFSTYIIQLYSPLNWFGTYYRMIQQNFIDMENMLELLQEEQEVVDLPGVGPLQVREGRLEMRNVSFHYQPERPILRSVSFCIKPGQTVALVGPSGAGKSTIIRLLFRLYDVTDGRIMFDNQDLKWVQQSSVRRSIGVVPQDTVLFNDTIGYNIRYGRRTANDDDVMDAAKAADLHHKIMGFPDEYDTQVGERGLKLSGGEKQRVAISRTLLKAPTYILLDEATSALDTQTERNIQASLRKVCSGRTTLIVAHRLSTIVHADQILVLKEGRIVERGSHDVLMDKAGLYADMWRQQSESDNGDNVNQQHQPHCPQHQPEPRQRHRRRSQPAAASTGAVKDSTAPGDTSAQV